MLSHDLLHLFITINILKDLISYLLHTELVERQDKDAKDYLVTKMCHGGGCYRTNCPFPTGGVVHAYNPSGYYNDALSFSGYGRHGGGGGCGSGCGFNNQGCDDYKCCPKVRSCHKVIDCAYDQNVCNYKRECKTKCRTKIVSKCGCK